MSKVIIVLGIIIVVIGGFALSGWILMLLWNWIVAGVFGWITLSYWQAVGVTLLLSFVGSAFKASSN